MSIYIKSISKSYRDKKALQNCTLTLNTGIYALLGPNGAGKTTMMKMITNLWKPTTGDIEIFGEILTPKSYAVQKKSAV